MTEYVVAYTLPITGRTWHTFHCVAVNSLEAVRQCCMAIPTANIQNVCKTEDMKTIQ